MIPWKSSRPDHVVRRNTKKLESGAPFLSARRCEGNDESVLKLCANCPWKVFQGKNIILNSRWISKGKENLTSIGRIRTTKGGEKGKKGRDKVFLLHQLFNFAIPCLVILNRVTSDELSIREPFELVCQRHIKWNKHTSSSLLLILCRMSHRFDRMKYFYIHKTIQLLQIFPRRYIFISRSTLLFYSKNG